jgi:hypothetical protein
MRSSRRIRRALVLCTVALAATTTGAAALGAAALGAGQPLQQVASGGSRELPAEAGRAAASPARGDWTPWYDCWEPMEEAATTVLMCLLPAEHPAAARMVTVDNGRVLQERVIRPDGLDRAVAEGGCTGTERAVWSRDGRRLFLRTELDCRGVTRIATSVLAFVSETQLLDAQAVTVQGQHAARPIRYRLGARERVPAGVAMQLPDGRELVRQTARLNAALPLDLEAVAEASSQVAPPALEALLAARPTRLTLDAKSLLWLEEWGVPASVLDLLIALAHPSRFAVREERAVPQRLAQVDPCDDGVHRALVWDPICDSLSRDRYGRYDPFGYNRYGYNRYGYNRYGYTSRYGYGLGAGYWDYGYWPVDSWRVGQPVVVIVRDGEQQRPALLVKGQGYTQGGAGTTGTARPRSAGTSIGSGATPRPALSPAPAAGGGTSSGTSSGSPPAGSTSGTSTGRTAVPRPGGGI